MKLTTAFVTALTLLGFAGAASAECAGMHQPPVDQTAGTPVPIWPKPEAKS
jgi:hypothetical protein